MRRASPFFIAAALAVILSACNMPSGTPNAAATLQAVYTAQVITPQPLTTQDDSGSGKPAPLPTLAFPTLPPGTLTAPAPSPTATSIPPTSTPAVPCDWAAFITDVTIPDGTIIQPGVKFTKVWRLKNIGACAWTGAYALAFENGNLMGGNAITKLPQSVGPGQTVDVSVNLIAPATPGEYKGYWLLRDAAGQGFGVGSRTSDPFWVDIQVTGPMSQVYSFANQYCSAAWSSGFGNLGCPGDLYSNSGNVNEIQDPKLENGQIYEGLALLTVPENKNKGYIKGIYPAFAVKSGDRFRAETNCDYQSVGCNVILQLNYQAVDGTISTLWQYNEVYGDQLHSVDVDLSALNGTPVKFMLNASANGAFKNDEPVWVNPRIERLDNLITPTTTPTLTATPTPHP